jgi:hypothetical protein
MTEKYEEMTDDEKKEYQQKRKKRILGSREKNIFILSRQNLDIKNIYPFHQM